MNHELANYQHPPLLHSEPLGVVEVRYLDRQPQTQAEPDQSSDRVGLAMVITIGLLALVALVAVARPAPIITEPVDPVIVIQRHDGTPVTVINPD